MKKQCIYIIVILLFPIFIFGQNEEQNPRREVGLNIGHLVRNLLRNDTDFPLASDRNYLLTYKVIQGKTVIRYGINFSRFYSANGFQPNRKFLQTSFRVGIGTQSQIDNKWQINRGVDIALKYSDFGNVFFEEDSRIIQAGFVPFAGIQYNINPRIHLSTEAGFGFFYTNRKNVSTIIGPSIENVSGSGQIIQLQPPQELILSISF